MPTLYRLEGKIPIVCKTLAEWSETFVTGVHLVGNTQFGNVTIITIFLGFDANDEEGTSPHFFETTIYHGNRRRRGVRSSTWEQAEMTHKNMVQKVKHKSDRGPAH
jgi:hypothetical protein